MENYIKLFFSITLLTLFQSTFTMEADPHDINEELTAEEHNQQIAIFQCPDEILLNIIIPVAHDPEPIQNAKNIFKALKCLPIHTLNLVCRKFNSLTKDKKSFEKLKLYYQNILREFFLVDDQKLINVKSNNLCMIRGLKGKIAINFQTLMALFLRNETNLITINNGYNPDHIVADLTLGLKPKLAIKCIPLVIFYGADVNSTNNDSYDFGDTPLHLAARNGNTKITQLLLSNPKVLINPTNKYGNTPLMSACQSTRDQKDTVELLLAKDADTKIEDLSHRTAKEIALKKGFDNIAKLIEDYELSLN